MQVLQVILSALAAYIICFLVEGDFTMETITAAIIGGVVAILLNIIVEFAGWKGTKKRINELNEMWKNAIGFEKNTSGKSIMCLLGNYSADDISLSGEHKNISNEIKQAKKEIQAFPNQLKEHENGIRQLINPQKEMLIRIDERQKNAEAIRKNREELLTPEQLDIKKLIDSVSAMSDNWQKINAELIEYKNISKKLRLKLATQNKEIDHLNEKINDLISVNADLKKELEKKNSLLHKKSSDLNNINREKESVRQKISEYKGKILHEDSLNLNLQKEMEGGDEEIDEDELEL